MKILHITFLLVLQLSYSQNEKNLKIQYNEFMAQNPKMIVKSLGTLHVSKDYSFYKSESIKTEKNNTDNDGDVIVLESKDKNLMFSEIIVNKKEKILTERLYENIFLKKHFAVRESVPVMKWKILSEEKKIKNYVCKKAKVTFRGRTYTAWYTEKIPISSGPWKFNGLPGLILSVEDDKGIYKWETNSIKYPLTAKEFDFKKNIIDNPKFKKISFEEFDKKRIKAIYQKIEIIRSRNANRERKARYSYSTFLEKEPINEWRNKMDFE